MIFGISRRALQFTRRFLSLQNTTHTPRAFFSRAAKFQEFRTVLESEIKEETSGSADLGSLQKNFKQLGWKIKQENTLVELSKRVDDYDVRLLSNIKAPTFQEEGGQGEPEVEMNEVTACVTKLGSSRTMAIHIIVANGVQITRIAFASSYEHVKEHRLDPFTLGDYNGPIIDTLPKELFQNVSDFLVQELLVTNSVLESLAQYCRQSEQGFYIGWLKDLKNVL